MGDTLVMSHRKEIIQGLFPGEFYYSDVFPRSQPFRSARIIVEGPDDLDLQINTIGNGLTDQVEESNGLRRHVVTLAPQSYSPEEVRAVAQIDRDPALLVSTFKSYREMGLAYAAAALRDPTLGLASVFFRTGSLVFGGGHVVLPLLQSEIVGRGWLDRDTFLTG